MGIEPTTSFAVTPRAAAPRPASSIFILYYIKPIWFNICRQSRECLNTCSLCLLCYINKKIASICLYILKKIILKCICALVRGWHIQAARPGQHPPAAARAAQRPPAGRRGRLLRLAQPRATERQVRYFTRYFLFVLPSILVLESI